MRISHLAAIVAVPAICAIPAFAQTPKSADDTSMKHPTQGVSSSMVNSQQYGSPIAQKQKTQGLPPGVSDPQYGGVAAKQKASGVPAWEYGAQKQP